MQKTAATNARNFRSFLLMKQFAAEEIGLRIAQARPERGLTQEQLAEIASFSKRSLQDYEAGVTIPYKHLQELGRLLGKETEWFLYGDPAGSTRDPDVAEALSAVVAEFRDETRRFAESVTRLEELLAERRPHQEQPGRP